MRLVKALFWPFSRGFCCRQLGNNAHRTMHRWFTAHFHEGERRVKDKARGKGPDELLDDAQFLLLRDVLTGAGAYTWKDSAGNQRHYSGLEHAYDSLRRAPGSAGSSLAAIHARLGGSNKRKMWARAEKLTKYKYHLKKQKEKFKASRPRRRAMMVACRWLGKSALIEYYRSKRGVNERIHPRKKLKCLPETGEVGSCNLVTCSIAHGCCLMAAC